MNDIVKPKIIIGMPVYNSSKFLHNSITSLLNQSYKNFILIISDNGSTDDTKLICEEFANKDKRIRYIHHKINRGYVWNFDFLLNQADTEYFMWAGSDDTWHPDFIEKNINFLEKMKLLLEVQVRLNSFIKFGKKMILKNLIK